MVLVWGTGFLCVALAGSVDQAGPNLRDPPASASQVLGLKRQVPPPQGQCATLHPILNQPKGLVWWYTGVVDGGEAFRGFFLIIEPAQKRQLKLTQDPSLL